MIMLLHVLACACMRAGSLLLGGSSLCACCIRCRDASLCVSFTPMYASCAFMQGVGVCRMRTWCPAPGGHTGLAHAACGSSSSNVLAPLSRPCLRRTASCAATRRLSHTPAYRGSRNQWQVCRPYCSASGNSDSSSSQQDIPTSSQAPSAADGSSRSSAAAGSANSPAAAEPTPASLLTVEAVHADAAATIDAIQRLTRSAEAQESASSGSNTDAAVAEQSQQQPPDELQQPLQQLAAAAASAWISAQQHWQSLLAMLAAAYAAVTANLSKFPSWVAAQKLQKLQEAADDHPQDAAKQAAYLAALNQSHPRDVLARVESKKFASNPAVVVEYLRALVASERLNEYADLPGSSSSSTSAAAVGLGPLPAAGQDHRSLLQLLKELQGMAEGKQEEIEPGSSLRRPLHVVLQGPGIARLQKPSGPLQLLWGMLSTVVLLLGLSFAWLVGNQALRRMSTGVGSTAGQPSSSVVAGSPAAAGAAGAAGVSAAAAAGPGIEPKEYKKEELPETSVKSFKDVKGCDESKAELQVRLCCTSFACPALPFCYMHTVAAVRVECCT